MLFLASSAFAQKDVASLNPKHAAAVQEYLQKHKELSFLSTRELQEAMSEDEFKGMKELVGPNPLYAVGDFNRDRFGDFAIILLRDVEHKTPESESFFREGSYMIFDSVLVVFNGTKRGFVVAHEMDVDGPFHFVSSNGKKAGLYSSCTESDADSVILFPAGKGYIEQFDGH